MLVAEHTNLSSFRDPAGRVIVLPDRVLRIVNDADSASARNILESPAVRKAIAAGSIPATSTLSADEARRALNLGASDFQNLVLEHERIGFRSFPYEWPAAMLHSAGALTLNLAETLLDEGLGLKDATPYNVLFNGARPVFVDLLSIERRRPGDPIWRPYAQFVRTFLLPLLAWRYYRLSPNQTLVSRRDGLEPNELYRWTPWLRRFSPRFVTLVSIPTWLAGKAHSGIYSEPSGTEPERAQHILRGILRGLRRTLNGLAPRPQASKWSDYVTNRLHYSNEQTAQKRTFVNEFLASRRPRTVLDIGCNTGEFSELAASAGSRVVAIDSDPVVLDNVWRNASDRELDILPLHIDLSRPTPGIGWRNSECPSFLDRTRGRFDAVLMLAVIHHLIATERIPLPEILFLASELTTQDAVIEFIEPADKMFRFLSRGRDSLYSGLTRDYFEAVCTRYFRILKRQQLHEGTRCLYLLSKN